MTKLEDKKAIQAKEAEREAEKEVEREKKIKWKEEYDNASKEEKEKYHTIPNYKPINEGQ